MKNINIERLVRFVDNDEQIKRLLKSYIGSSKDSIKQKLHVMTLMQAILVKYKKEKGNQLMLNPDDRLTASDWIIKKLGDKRNEEARKKNVYL